MPNWGLLVLVGVLSLIAGGVALLFPLPATLTVTAFVGASLLVVGVLGAIAAWREAAGSDRTWGVLTGIATAALGAILFGWPVRGATTLTILAGVIFLASGLFKLLMGWRLPVASWKWSVILSGVLTLILGIMVLAGLPETAAIVPGLLLAIELLSYGWLLVFLGIAWKRSGL